jgi:hypothetical protein
VRILSIVPCPTYADTERFPCVARFDVEVEGRLRLYNLRLLRAPDGTHLTYAPSAAGKRCATFTPDFAKELTAAAMAALGGRTANDKLSAA